MNHTITKYKTVLAPGAPWPNSGVLPMVHAQICVRIHKRTAEAEAVRVKVLDFIKNNPYTTSRIMEDAGIVTRDTANKYARYLRAQGLITIHAGAYSGAASRTHMYRAVPTPPPSVA